MAELKVRNQSPGQDIEALITVVNQLSALANELKTTINALLVKLDADAGTDSDYEETLEVVIDAADTITRVM